MQTSRMIRQTGHICGVDFDFVTQSEISTIIDGWRDASRRGYVVLTNPHSVMLCRRNSKMHESTAIANLVLPDGVGIVLAAKILGYGRRHRVTGPALMLEVCDSGREFGLRHFFYGGAEGVAGQ